MPQLPKLIRSRDDWRTRAVQRADELREHRKTHKRDRAHIAELKQPLDALHGPAEADKKTPATTAKSVVDLSQAQEVRTLRVLLVIQAVVSYRSVQRILDLFNALAGFGLGWVPHFTSVIN
ncbi:hypothetical protein [Methylovulum sp.]|uniref:hypothetical protein n=1 Tax=Methylovulum sp. TaxID=1916980 RepID=UPI00260D0ACD|nr:hypothetical protein [Methylovulum sp.]MDD5123615.1 hypothetical protein [Methylovulum sp.]